MVGKTFTLDDAGVVQSVRRQVGELTSDEAALVRSLTPRHLSLQAEAEHMLDLADLLTTIREEEATADYVYAFAPDWDGSIEVLVMGGRLSAACARHELERAG
jgi:hypothetical protein